MCCYYADDGHSCKTRDKNLIIIINKSSYYQTLQCCVGNTLYVMAKRKKIEKLQRRIDELYSRRPIYKY